MKFSNRKAFEKHLIDCKPGFLSSLYLIQSKDGSEIGEVEQAICEHYRSALAKARLSLKVYSSEDYDDSLVAEEASGFSLFKEDMTMLLIRGIDKLKVSQQEKLQKILEKKSDTKFILSASSLASSSALYKSVEKRGIVLDLNEEKPWEKHASWVEWIRLYLSQLQVEIDPEAANMLIKEYGADRLQLKQEIAKLLTYLGNRKRISSSDIVAVCCIMPQDTIWQFLDALSGKQVSQAYKVLKTLRESGLSTIALIRQIRGQFHTACQISSHLESGKPASELATLFPRLKGKMLDRQIEGARRWKNKNLQNILISIDETEHALKNSNSDEQLLTDMLISRICH